MNLEIFGTIKSAIFSIIDFRSLDIITVIVVYCDAPWLMEKIVINTLDKESGNGDK